MRKILYAIQFGRNPIPTNPSGTIRKGIHRPSYCITSVSGLLFGTAFFVVLVLAMTPSAADAACGDEGQRACCLGEPNPGCMAGLVQAGSCSDVLGSGNCGTLGCSIGVCAPVTNCGGVGERGCCVIERVPSCDGDLIEDLTPGCTDKLGFVNCVGKAAGVSCVSLGVCREKRMVGESCDPVFDPCADGLLCQVVNFDPGPEYVCFADLDELVSVDECNFFYNPATHQVAIADGTTLSFGYGFSLAAGVATSVERGVVYLRDECYGCYETACFGAQSDLAISDFAALTATLTDTTAPDFDSNCNPLNFNCFSFDGKSCVVTGDVSTPVAEVGASAMVISACNNGGCTGTCRLIGDGLAFSFGIGVAPFGAGVWDCTTQMRVTGCLEDGDLVAQTNEPPEALCKDLLLAADANCTSEVSEVSVDDGSFDPDGLPTDLTCTQSPSASSEFALGDTMVSLECTDADGEMDSCTATVTVADQTAPDVACPADRTVECTGNEQAETTYGAAIASDNCTTSPSVSCTPPSGSSFPLGSTTVTCTATDEAANTGACSLSVAVQDTTPPEIQCNAPATIIPPDAPISFTATATDICGEVTPVITSFECFKFTKRGKRIDKTDSCVVTYAGDTVTISDSGGVGDIITWTVTTTDDSGNSAEIGCELEVVKPAGQELTRRQ